MIAPDRVPSESDVPIPPDAPAPDGTTASRADHATDTDAVGRSTTPPSSSLSSSSSRSGFDAAKTVAEADVDVAAARARRRRRLMGWLGGYALLYAAVFSVYGYQYVTRDDPTPPVVWLDGAFPGWRTVSDDPQGPSTEAMAALAERQRPSDAAWDDLGPGERRVTRALMFTPVEPGATRIALAEGDRLTPPRAAALGAALAHDVRALERGVDLSTVPWRTPRPELPRAANGPSAGVGPTDDGATPGGEASSSATAKEVSPGTEPPTLPDLPFMHDTVLTGLPWAYGVNVLNIAGFYLLIGLFLWDFLMRFLDGERAKAADGLARAQAAEAEAEELRRLNAALTDELESRHAAMNALADAEGAVEQTRLLALAHRDAATRRAGFEDAVAAEIAAARHRLTVEVSRAVLRRAKQLLAEQATEEDHAFAVEKFIRSLESKDAWSSAIWKSEDLP